MNDIPNNTPVEKTRLQIIVERIELFEKEKSDYDDAIKEEFKQAGNEGFDAKILRKVIALRRKDRHERAEEDVILELYMQELGMPT